MRLSFKFFIFCLFIAQPVLATQADTIWTVYENGEFITRARKMMDVSPRIADELTDRFVNDFHSNPGNLFNWALKDLGLQKKGNELIIVFKSSTHNYKTGITHGVFDVDVPYVKTFKNIEVDAIVAKTMNSNGQTKVKADIIYSTWLLDKANAIFMTIPQKNGEQYLVCDVRLEFGWFFNLFITKKRYKSIVEWRIKKFTSNMHEESLKMKRASEQKTNSSTKPLTWNQALIAQ